MKKFIAGILAVVMAAFCIATPVFAETCTCDNGKEGVKTAILSNGCSCEDGSGNSVTSILKLVVDIVSVLVGILAVAGIAIVGIQYMTAGGNEQQTTKAKRRMLEIIIGVIAYAGLYALLSFLGVWNEQNAADVGVNLVLTLLS